MKPRYRIGDNNDSPQPDDPDRLVGPDDLIATGADPAKVRRLPIRHVQDGEPYWSLSEALDLLALMEAGT